NRRTSATNSGVSLKFAGLFRRRGAFCFLAIFFILSWVARKESSPLARSSWPRSFVQSMVGYTIALDSSHHSSRRGGDRQAVCHPRSPTGRCTFSVTHPLASVPHFG